MFYVFFPNSDIGAHVDGFIAVLAHTFVIGASLENPVTGKKADAIRAAHDCAEAAYRLVKPGAVVRIGHGQIYPPN